MMMVGIGIFSILKNKPMQNINERL